MRVDAFGLAAGFFVDCAASASVGTQPSQANDRSERNVTDPEKRFGGHPETPTP